MHDPVKHMYFSYIYQDILVNTYTWNWYVHVLVTVYTHADSRVEYTNIHTSNSIILVT